MKSTLALAVVLLITFCAGCNSGANSNNANRVASANRNENANANRAGEGARQGGNDGWITMKTKLALIADGRTSGFATDVDTQGGVVTLSGKVDTEQAKSAATEVAKGIDGVTSVNNQLQVVPDAKRAEVNEADDKIEDSIKKATEADANLKALGLSTDSNAGVVTLNGTVDTQAQLLSAAQAIRRIPGVKRVVTTAVTVRNEGR